jgi:hypothetical protein
MSLLTDLIFLRALNQLKGSKFIVLLAIVYLFFIFRSSFIAELILALIVFLFLAWCTYALSKDAENAKKTTDMTASEKAYMANWKREQEAKRKPKDNPYE